MNTNDLRAKIIDTAVENAADLVGFAPASRFPADDALWKLFPRAKTVVGLLFRVLRGSLRGVEEGTTYYQYTTMSVENLEETVMPFAALRVAQTLEAAGFTALPQRRHQLIMEDERGVNPEVQSEDIFRGVKGEPQLDFTSAAVKCGLGEAGLHGSLLTEEFGPLQRWCFVVTDAELEGTPLAAPHLCDSCRECVKACPGRAIGEDGKRDDWRCALYYSGANGTKNPFMPPDAFSEHDDRVKIIAGEADITPERAETLLRELFFYPPAMHSYRSSICGKACDTACYVHLEEKGKLTKSFRLPFRRRPEWRFDIKDFE